MLKSIRSLTVLLGLGLAWGACSHPEDNATGAGGSGSPGLAGSNQSGIAGSTGTAGQTQVTGVAGSGSPQGTAGTGAGDAGSEGPQGTAGAAGTSSGGSTGTAGTTAAAGAGPIVDMVDNLEDNDGKIIQAQGRQGPWHSFNNQMGGNQVPAFNGTFTPAAGGANNSAYAVHTTGSGYSFAGVGFDLNNTGAPEGAQSQSYNASAYTGISFWAKGNGNLRVELAQKAFVPTANGGSCSSGSCWNVYGSRDVQGKLTSSWQQFTIMFNAASMQREDGSKSPAFDASQLMSISFKHEGSTFDFWLDDVHFVGGTVNPTGAAGSSGERRPRWLDGHRRIDRRCGVVWPGWLERVRHGERSCIRPQSRAGERLGFAVLGLLQAFLRLEGKIRWAQSRNKLQRSRTKALVRTDQQNACSGGGTAFMCWDHAPWEVDRTWRTGSLPQRRTIADAATSCSSLAAATMAA